MKNKKQNKSKSKQNGFTIVELVIVLAVFGVIFAVTLATILNLLGV